MSKKENSLQTELSKIKEEVLEAQKEAILKEIIRGELELEYRLLDFTKKKENAIKNAKKDELDGVKQGLARMEQHQIDPLKENLEFRKGYYHFLCESLDMLSADVVKLDVTS